MTINRVYKIVLSLSIAIQLSLFFIAVTVGLWIDQLFNGAIGHLAAHKKLYEIMFIITLIVSPMILIFLSFDADQFIAHPPMAHFSETPFFNPGTAMIDRCYRAGSPFAENSACRCSSFWA